MFVHVVMNTSQTKKLTVMVTSLGQSHHWTSQPMVFSMGIACMHMCTTLVAKIKQLNKTEDHQINCIS